MQQLEYGLVQANRTAGHPILYKHKKHTGPVPLHCKKFMRAWVSWLLPETPQGFGLSKLNFLKPSTIFHVPKLGYAWSVLEGQELLAVREQGFLAWVKLVVPNQSIGKSV